MGALHIMPSICTLPNSQKYFNSLKEYFDILTKWNGSFTHSGFDFIFVYMSYFCSITTEQITQWALEVLVSFLLALNINLFQQPLLFENVC